MSPSLYDLLDLEPTAGEAEIRAAWKAAIADLDPTDRRFRAYNQAAEVLLDPRRRAAYDAELVSAQPEPDPELDPQLDQAPEPVGTGASAVTPAPTAKTSPVTASGSRRTVPTWLLAALAVLTFALVAATAFVATRPSDSAVQDATRAAQAAAERAIVPILSYDYRSLEEDQAAAQPLMTSDYREEYDRLFAVLEDNAPRTETVVDVEVIASGVVRADEDRAEILVFLNRPTTNAENEQPVVYKDQVRVQVENVEGTWLVDCLVTSPDDRC